MDKKSHLYVFRVSMLIFFLCFLQAERSFGGIRLALVPFQVEESQGKEIIRCLSCGNILPGGQIEGDPSFVLTRLLWEKLQGKSKEIEWISPGQVEGVYNLYLAKSIEKNPQSLMTALGKQLNADYMLWGMVSRYQERIGSSFAIQQPASVAMDIHLLKVNNGRIVWRAQWAQTQKSLTENLLEMGSFFKRKMRWVTVEELSIQGIEEMLKDFPSAETLK